MSVIFGKLLGEEVDVDAISLREMAAATARYGPDGTYIKTTSEISMAFQAFHTHLRSRLEGSPVVGPSGNLAVIDGRLDNFNQLIGTLEITTQEPSDSEIVLTAFDRWGEDCFSHFIGDWAIAVWVARARTLFLGRDHAGTRTLFYRNNPIDVCWSSYLEGLLSASTNPALNRECIALSLTGREPLDITRYAGINAVAPACYIAINKYGIRSRRYWSCRPETPLDYRTDSEYDEHFREALSLAVERRVGKGAPVIMHLSGGVDSSSIVCIGDSLAQSRPTELSMSDTLSYFDDSEPDWDERPYFTLVEERRGRCGIHLDCSFQQPTFQPLSMPGRKYPYAGMDSSAVGKAEQFEDAVGKRGFRAIIAGYGGDELLGGIPAPLPELADHLVRGRGFHLLSRAAKWSLLTKQPVARTLYETLSFTIGLYSQPNVNPEELPPWLTRHAKELTTERRSSERSSISELFAMPSSISTERTWERMLETLPHYHPHLLGCYEFRYPYLDREFVEFIVRVPREVLLQPGRRRMLMRRALKDIVPTEVLERRRKARVSRGPLVNMRSARSMIEQSFENSMLADFGLVDEKAFLKNFHDGLRGELKWLSYLINTISAELWLRGCHIAV